MKRSEIKEVVKRFLNSPTANDSDIAHALGMSKGNFSAYRDPLNKGQVYRIKSWCFDNYEQVKPFIPTHWVDDVAA